MTRFLTTYRSDPHLQSVFKGIVALLIALGILMLVPTLYHWSAKHVHLQPFADIKDQFPVTVDPQNKVIVEDKKVNEFLASPDSPLQASVFNVKNAAWKLFAWAAETIEKIPWYQSIATADEQVVNIPAGLRKEQVASVFGKALGWTTLEQKEFLTTAPNAELPYIEGSYLPDQYVVSNQATPAEVQKLINDQFTQQVLSHYGSGVDKVVPLEQALNIASIIQRETLGTEDMRLVSGILWNRIFNHMKLQVDSTLQYAKSTGRPSASWWPVITPADKYIKSPYNTYMNEGLPPTAIANPSVAAVLAALNPIQTTCLFYFNDPHGNIICTDNYKDHVAALKKYYGQGK